MSEQRTGQQLRQGLSDRAALSLTCLLETFIARVHRCNPLSAEPAPAPQRASEPLLLFRLSLCSSRTWGWTPGHLLFRTMANTSPALLYPPAIPFPLALLLVKPAPSCRLWLVLCESGRPHEARVQLQGGSFSPAHILEHGLFQGAETASW